MSSSKKKQTISDKIHEVLKPKELAEDNDENEARFEEFSELHDVDNQLSDIRKQNAKALSELDSKYKGKVVSRHQLDESDDSSDSEEEDAKSDAYATDSDEQEGSADESSADEGNEDDSENSSEAAGSEDDEDDYDISQFMKAPPTGPTASTSTASRSQESKNQLLKGVSVDEEVKKGVCVQNQLKLWEKLLEVRIKSQKMLITANSLPDYNAHLELSTSDDPTFAEKVEKTCDGIYGLLDNLMELQSTLVNR